MNPHPPVNHNGGHPAFPKAVEDYVDDLSALAFGPGGVEKLEATVAEHQAQISGLTARRDAQQELSYRLIARLAHAPIESVGGYVLRLEQINARVERLELAIAEHQAAVLTLTSERDLVQAQSYTVVADLRKTVLSHEAAINGSRTPLCGLYQHHDRSVAERREEAQREVAQRAPA